MKRGPGGIRDVEFAVQLLQLVHGRVDAELRARGTLAALDDARAAAATSTPTTPTALADSYRFLRRVEHVVQLEDERQTHSVPADRDRAPPGRPGARLPRARPRPGPTEAFDRELAAHRAAGALASTSGCGSGRCSASLSGAGPLGEAATAERLAAFGFADVERTRQAVAELTRGLTRSSRMMQQLLPLLLDWLSASPDPDLGLLGLRRAGVRRAAVARALATAFRDSPEVARHLALLLGTSRQLGDVLVANPDLIERLPDPSRLAHPSRGTSSSPARTSVIVVARRPRRAPARAAAVEAAPPPRRRGAGRVRPRRRRAGRAPTSPASPRPRSRARCASLDPQVPFAVVAFGRFGGAELGYASDLDVAFVHEGADARRGRAGGRRACSASSAATPRPSGSGPSTPTSAPRAAAGRWRAASTAGTATSPGGRRPGSARPTCASGAVAGDAALGARLVDRIRDGRRGSGRSPATTSARCAA